MPTRRLELAALAVATLLWAARAEAQSPYGIGRAATPAEIAGWNIDVGGDGSNLPPGIGSVSHGSEVFAQQCAACHGAKGEGGVGDRLVGGQGTLGTPKPVRTVGSYWPYAPTLFDYIRRAMPITNPQSLQNEEVYALTAYILSFDNVVPKDAVLDANSLPKVQMPNKAGFVNWEPRLIKP